MSDYIAVDPALALPPHFRLTEKALRQFDPKLRLRKAVDQSSIRRGCPYILEIKTRHTKPPDVSERRRKLRGLTDVQVASRDGYLVISPVHILIMDKPAAIIAELKRSDLADYSSGDQFFRELVHSVDDADAKVKRGFRDDYGAFARESFDLLDRVGDKHSHAERMRISNAGGEERFNIIDRRRVKPEDLGLSPQGAIPKQEMSDEHQPSA